MANRSMSQMNSSCSNRLQEAFGAREHAVVEAESDQAAKRIRVARGYVPWQVHRLTLVDHLGPDGEAGRPHPGRQFGQRPGQLELVLTGDEPCPADLEPAKGGGPVAAGHVEVAGEPDEREDGAIVLHAVCVVHHRRRARHDGGRPGRGVQPGRRADLLGRHAADALHSRKVEIGHVVPVLGEALRELGHELPVEQALLDDHVRHAEGQRPVRSRLELQMDVGARG